MAIIRDESKQQNSNNQLCIVATKMASDIGSYQVTKSMVASMAIALSISEH